MMHLVRKSCCVALLATACHNEVNAIELHRHHAAPHVQTPAAGAGIENGGKSDVVKIAASSAASPSAGAADIDAARGAQNLNQPVLNHLTATRAVNSKKRRLPTKKAFKGGASKLASTDGDSDGKGAKTALKEKEEEKKSKGFFGNLFAMGKHFYTRAQDKKAEAAQTATPTDPPATGSAKAPQAKEETRKDKPKPATKQASNLRGAEPAAQQPTTKQSTAKQPTAKPAVKKNNPMLQNAFLQCLKGMGAVSKQATALLRFVMRQLNCGPLQKCIGPLLGLDQDLPLNRVSPQDRELKANDIKLEDKDCQDVEAFNVHDDQGNRVDWDDVEDDGVDNEEGVDNENAGAPAADENVETAEGQKKPAAVLEAAEFANVEGAEEFDI